MSAAMKSGIDFEYGGQYARLLEHARALALDTASAALG